jgi:hypothetical protein
MKAPTILLLCATAIGAIAFHPSAASADVVFSTGSQGTSISIGDSRPIYQPVIIEQRNPEWRYREEERLREEHRLAEQRSRLAERQEQQRLAERRERERIAERRQNEQRLANRNSSHNSNIYQRNNNSSNNTQRDRYDR